ncbi:hypothetical protein F0562_011926 [Nyssa sinensis]|uniref:Uncharacterized protein n=1 Tax=Nyssa sinensis TaxID=561372 RepID=A0A5J4ZVS1_9ASTE|nr:hypothetical protein F0562_011926 [Nyssa sinensis]
MAKETFSDKENTYEIIQIEGILHDLRQSNLTVTEYFNTLTRLWRQLDTFEVHNWSCVTDGLLYKKIVEGKRVFKFLLGLNKNLDEIRGRIMGVKLLPSLREAFSKVRREESQKNLMMGSHQQLNMAESLALKTQFTPFDNRQKIKGGRPWCDHCRKLSHSRETCWKIHRKLADWKPRQPIEKEGRGNHVATDEQSPQPEASPFNKEQMEMLQKLLSPFLSVQSQTGSSSNQGENSTQEYQFWNPESFSESPITSENHIPPESFSESPITTENHIPLELFNQPWYQPKFIVDLRDNDHIQEEMEEGALSQQTHKAEPDSNPSKIPGGGGS